MTCSQGAIITKADESVVTAYALIHYKAWSLKNQCTTAGQCPVGGVADLVQGALTPSVGAVLRPIAPLAVYASYMEGLVQGGTAPASAANAYEVLAPTRSRQLEAGAKWDLSHMQWTAALFRIQQVNEYLDTSDNRYKQDGRQVNQGAELTVTGTVVDGLAAIGGISLLRSRVERAASAELEGKVPVNVPQLTARMFLEYALPFTPRLYVGAGGNVNGARYVDPLNQDHFAPSATFDAGLRYQSTVYGHAISAAVFVANLADQRYWTYYRSGAGLLLGAPRTLSLSAKVSL
jgi:iron complex outermembrane receptor protein